MADMLRGHKMYQDDEGVWRFCDTNELTETTWASRPCGYCGRYGSSNDGLPDPCLGQLAGVTNACCGHGNPSQAYICFMGGVVLRGFTVDVKKDEHRIVGDEEHDLIMTHNRARKKFLRTPGC